MNQPWISRTQCTLAATPAGLEVRATSDKASLKFRGEHRNEAVVAPGEEFKIHRLKGRVLAAPPEAEALVPRAGAPGTPGSAPSPGAGVTTQQLRAPRVGSYEILPRLGGGMWGGVHLARDPAEGRAVVLKFLESPAAVDDSDLARWSREVRVLGSIEHPGIARVLDSGELTGRRYIVEEFVDGKGLDEEIAVRRGETRWAAETALSIARALGKSHSRGVLHRDLRPKNVRIDAEGRPRLIDFGGARILGLERLTPQTRGAATLPYLAPDLFEGGEASPSTDVYALGMILFESLAGLLPFRGESEEEIVREILEESVLAPSALAPGLDPALDAICARAIEKSIDRRYAGPNAFAYALVAYLEGTPP